MENGLGERDESVTEMQYDHSHITIGESMTVTEAFERGELSTFYQRPSASQMMHHKRWLTLMTSLLQLCPAQTYHQLMLMLFLMSCMELVWKSIHEHHRRAIMNLK